MFSLTWECQNLSLQYKCYNLYKHKGQVPSKGLDEEGFINILEIEYIVMKTQVGGWSRRNKCREEKKKGEGREYEKEELSLKAI